MFRFSANLKRATCRRRRKKDNDIHKTSKIGQTAYIDDSTRQKKKFLPALKAHLKTTAASLHR